MWQTTPAVSQRTPRRLEGAPERRHAFPSGRQALVGVLRELGCGRPDRVAIPEWSSHCVVSAVGRLATPLPLREALAAGAECRAVLVYEQWGWSYPAEALAVLRERLPQAALILDRVDTPDLGPPHQGWTGFEVWSLSKTLGFRNGGMARVDGERWLPFSAPEGPDMLERVAESLPETTEMVDVLRVHAQRPDDACAALFDAGGVADAFVREAALRRERTEFLLRELGSDRLRERYETAQPPAAPGLFPLGWGLAAETLAALETAARAAGLETARYHFDGAGSALAPDYRPCVAIPTHGAVPMETLAELADARKRHARGRSRGVVVMGGGLAGLAAGGWLGQRGADVTVVEKEPEVGGMLRSHVTPDGTAFDIGTHFAIETGAEEIDSLLFDALPGVEFWTFRESLKEGHYWNGRLNTETGCIDARTLPNDVLNTARDEFLSAAGDAPAAGTAFDRLTATMGATLTERIYRPVLMKLTGRELESLPPEMVDQFSIPRIVLFGSRVAALLKRDAAFDGRLAFARRFDGASSIRKLYPKGGGIGAWMGALRRKIEATNVEVLTGTGAVGLDFDGERVRSVRLDDGRALPCDTLVWTGPAEGLLAAIGRPPKRTPPSFRDLVVYHLSSAEALETDLHWVCNYDPAFASYRITQYPNMGRGPRPTPPHHVTVEVLVDPETQAPDGRMISEELRAMGLVPEGATMEIVRTERYPKAFPVLSPADAAAAAERRDAAAAVARNVVLTGRSSGHFHQIPMLLDLHAKLRDHAAENSHFG